MSEAIPTNPEQRETASFELDRVKDKILRTWESRVRNAVSAPSKSDPVLRSQVSEILNNLVSNISLDSNRPSFEEAGKIGKKYGEQRASSEEYTFSQLFLEYRILRQVVFEVLDQEQVPVSNVRDIILNVLDEGTEKAIEQFSHIRSQDLKRSNQDLVHFAAIAAHDLKSPLATIAGFVELLEDNLRGRIDVEEVEFIQAIKRSAASMTLLIDRLLTYSSVGTDNPSFEEVSLDQTVTAASENLQSAIEKLKAKISYEDLPTVWGDPSLLSQLFQNLMSNALKFRDPRRTPEITINAIEQGNSWLISVKDNGVGFDTKDKEQIFSLFKRLDSAKSPGLGIGLATVRKVVELHEGKVWAESEPGRGSTFFITLPKIPN